MKYLRLFDDHTNFNIDGSLDIWVAYDNEHVHYSVSQNTTPNNEIWYTTTDGNVYNLTNVSELGITYAINLISNTYEDGIGKMVFDGDVTQLSVIEYDEGTGMPIGNVYPMFTPLDADSTLKTIQLPSSVTNIGASAFIYCNSLISINIPSNVTSIGDDAFNDCSSLTSITYKGVTYINDGSDSEERYQANNGLMTALYDNNVYVSTSAFNNTNWIVFG